MLGLNTACGQKNFEDADVQVFSELIEDSCVIVLDVRTPSEFAEGHIPGAINVANEDIGAEQPIELPDLDQVIFVYCRSGRRSKEASAKLAALGYTNIYEFGGILDWDGEIEN
jgi:rhodanese-related sulfurtransferase